MDASARLAGRAPDLLAAEGRALKLWASVIAKIGAKDWSAMEAQAGFSLAVTTKSACADEAIRKMVVGDGNKLYDALTDYGGGMSYDRIAKQLNADGVTGNRRANMLTIWGRPTSAMTQKVLWALGEIGLEFELILASGTMGPGGSVDKGNEPYGFVDTPAYRAMNPNGTVPTIKDGEFTLWESNSIVSYLAMKYAPELMYGDDIETFASASRWMDWEGNVFLPHQHTLVMHLVRRPPDERDPEAVEGARQALLRPLQIIEEQLARTPFMTGDRFTMGDIPVGTNVHRWFLFDLDMPDMPNLRRWYDVIRQRPAFLEHIADPAFHLSG